jgi:hypothetical protein
MIHKIQAIGIYKLQIKLEKTLNQETLNGNSTIFGIMGKTHGYCMYFHPSWDVLEILTGKVQHPVAKHPQYTFLSNGKRPSFTPIKTDKIIVLETKGVYINSLCTLCA